MLQQPRVPPTGQRQAIEIQIKWREVLAQKQALLRILARTTGHSEEKLDQVREPGLLPMHAPAWNAVHQRVCMRRSTRPSVCMPVCQ